MFDYTQRYTTDEFRKGHDAIRWGNPYECARNMLIDSALLTSNPSGFRTPKIKNKKKVTLKSLG